MNAFGFSARDKAWVFTRDGVLTATNRIEFACRCADRALSHERTAGREPDARSWAGVDAARRFARGEISFKEMRAALFAARAAVPAEGSDTYASAFCAYAVANVSFSSANANAAALAAANPVGGVANYAADHAAAAASYAAYDAIAAYNAYAAPGHSAYALAAAEREAQAADFRELSRPAPKLVRQPH